MAVPHERIVGLLATSVGEVTRFSLFLFQYRAVSLHVVDFFFCADQHEDNAHLHVSPFNRPGNACLHLKLCFERFSERSHYCLSRIPNVFAISKTAPKSRFSRQQSTIDSFVIDWEYQILTIPRLR